MTAVPFTSAPFTYPGGALAIGVRVRVYYGGTLVLAPIYWDVNGTRKANPLRTEDDGTVSFWAEPGPYDLLANGVTTSVVVPSGGGVPPEVDKGVVLEFSVASGSGAGTGKSKVYNDTGLALTLRSVRLTVDTVAGAAVILDVNKNGSTIFTNQALRPSVAAPGGTVKVLPASTILVQDGDYFTMDVDQSGSYNDLVAQIHLR